VKTAQSVKSLSSVVQRIRGHATVIAFGREAEERESKDTGHTFSACLSASVMGREDRAGLPLLFCSRIAILTWVLGVLGVVLLLPAQELRADSNSFKSARSKAQDCVAALLRLDQEGFDARKSELFDAMMQVANDMPVDSIPAVMKQEGIRCGFLFGRRAGGREMAEKVYAAFPKHFILGTFKLIDWWRERPEDFISEIEKDLSKGSYLGIGEIHIRYNEKTNDNMGGYVKSADSPHVFRVAELARKFNVVLYVHLEATHLEQDLEPFKRLLQTFRDVRFVWSHAGWADAELVGALLTQHPNLWVTLSRRLPSDGFLKVSELESKIAPNIFSDYKAGKLSPEWSSLIVRHSERMMFATGSNRPMLYQQMFGEYTQIFRQALSSLPEKTARDIGYRTAAKLFQSTAKSAAP
jgi:hypothetical protein